MKILVPLAVILIIAGAIVFALPQESTPEEEISLETEEQEEQEQEAFEALELKQEEEFQVSPESAFEHCLPETTREDSNYYTYRLKPLLKEQGANCERGMAVDRNGRPYYFHRPAQCFSGAQLDPWQVDQEQRQLEEKEKTHVIIILTCGAHSGVPSAGS